MAAVTGITIVKAMYYRGQGGEEFSSTYHFKTQPPGDDASWTVLMNDLLAQERTIYTAEVSFHRAYGYDSDDPTAHHVFAHDWTIPGPPPVGVLGAPANSNRMAGDQAALVQWRLDTLSAKGKPRYLRKYIHHGFVLQSDPDQIDSVYKGILGTFASNVSATTFHGGLRSQRLNDNVTASLVSPWTTTRTLKRRGKRPRTGS